MPLAFGSNLTPLDVTWTAFKSIATTKNFAHQVWTGDAASWTIFGVDGPFLHRCFIWTGDVPQPVIDAGYTQAQNDADKVDFTTNWLPTANKPVDLRAVSGAPQTEEAPRSGSKIQLFSHNFCDPLSWYQTSVRRTGLAMIDSLGTGLTWHMATPPAIGGVDVTHGRNVHEQAFASTYQPIVKANGTVLTEQDPHLGSGGDYIINYTTMTVTMLAPRLGQTITLDYSDVQNGNWTITPDAGRILRLLNVKLNYSIDVLMHDTFTFAVRAVVDKCPYLAAAWASGAFPAGTKLPLSTLFYSSLRDLLLEANGAQPTVAKSVIGSPTWRDLKQDYVNLTWEYEDQATIDLDSSWGMDVVIGLQHGVPCTGDGAFVTFYARSDPET